MMNTARQVLSVLTRFSETISPEFCSNGMWLKITWAANPPAELLDAVEYLHPELWCLVTESWRRDCSECPTCAGALGLRTVDGRTYIECEGRAVHYSQEVPSP